MKKQLLLTTLLILFLIIENIFSQAATPYEIGKWQGFRSCAISYTFDDNESNQLAIAVPMFNNYGYKLTLFTVIDWFPNWLGLQNAADQGHEIASHSVFHPDLDVWDAKQTLELQNSQTEINNHIKGHQCLTFAYPFCAKGVSSFVSQYYVAARGCQGYVEPSTPADFYNISSLVCGAVGPINSIEAFNVTANNTALKGGWCIYMIHALDSEGGYSPLSSAILRASLDYLTDDRKYWVSTFSNVARYIKERNASNISETVNPDNNIKVSVTNDLDVFLYTIPISIRRLLPDGWTTCSVKQKNEILPSRIVEINSIKYIMFDVVPNNGDITLIKNGTTKIENDFHGSVPIEYRLDQNYPNPFNPSTVISYQLANSSHVSIKVFDVFGKEIATLVNDYQQAGIHSSKFSIFNSQLSSGIYFYRLSTGNFVSTKKMLLIK